jgi:hypothetical protein
MRRRAQPDALLVVVAGQRAPRTRMLANGGWTQYRLQFQDLRARRSAMQTPANASAPCQTVCPPGESSMQPAVLTPKLPL